MAFLLQPPQWLMMPTNFLGNGKLGAYFGKSTLSRSTAIPSHATTTTRTG